MNASNFLGELKRRNVYRVAVTYAVVSWLLIQIATQVSPYFEVPNWTVRVLILLLAVCFPVALAFAWVYELTAEGFKRTEDVPAHESIRHHTGRKLLAITTVLAAIAIGWFLIRSAGLRSMLEQSGAAAVSDAHESAQNIPDKSIAVLPFENLSEDAANAFFADGMQDDVLADVAKIRDLKVISRTSSLSYRQRKDRNLREIGRALGVATVLEGSVRRSGSRVRVAVQLVSTRTGAHMWAETYDRDIADVFAIQSDIAEKITTQLRATLSPHERDEIAQPATADLVAFDLYTRARTARLQVGYGPLFKDRVLDCAKLLDLAVARDPNFMLAWCELANTHDTLYFAGYDHTPERLALAENAVHSALRLAPDSGVAHLAFAQHFYHGYRDYERAREQLEIASRTLPNSAELAALTAYIDRRQGRWDESTTHLERSIDLDPRNWFTLSEISVNYSHCRRYPEAAAVLDRAVAVAPSNVLTPVVRGWVDFDAKADCQPLATTISQIVSADPAAAPTVAGDWLHLALAMRDFAAADQALAALKSDDAFTMGHLLLRPTFAAGFVARVRGNQAGAHAAFTTARIQQEEALRSQPDNAPALCVLGLIDAALGRKEAALREGERAMALLPAARDTMAGVDIVVGYAIICAWTGENDLAFQQLTAAADTCSVITYGQLQLHPWWDPLRSDPRLARLLAKLQPSTVNVALRR